MKENMELERGDITIDSEMEVDGDIGQEITVYIETWFDADKKFGININAEEGTWLNLYGKFNPFDDTLRIECEISRDDGSSYFDYEPTAAEAQLIKDMITEKIEEKAQNGVQDMAYCIMADGTVINIDESGYYFSSKNGTYYHNARAMDADYQEEYRKGHVSFASGEDAIRAVRQELDEIGFSEL